MMRILLSFAARLIVTAAILAYLLSSIDLPAAWAAMLRIDPWWFAFTLILVALDRAVMAIRWILLLRAAGVDLPARKAVWIFLTSSFVGSFFPAGIGADVARAYAVTSRTSQGSQAAASVGVDRILGLIASFGLGAIGLAGWAQQLDPVLRTRLSVVAGVAGVATVAMMWMDKLVRACLPLPWHDTRWGWRILRLGDAVGDYRRHGRVLALVLFLSLAVQVLRVLQGYGVGRGLGIGVDLTFYMVFMPVVLLLLLLPVSVSGFGLPQAVMVWILRPLGVPDVESFAMSTLFIVIGLLGNLPGALLYAVRRKPVT